VSEFVVATNLIGFATARAQDPFFAWPTHGKEAQVIHAMEPGDLIVPKFSQSTGFEGAERDWDAYLKAICEAIGVDYAQARQAYADTILGGQGAVPFAWRVTKRMPDDPRFPSDMPWARVGVEILAMQHPLSTHEFLLLRVLPISIAKQFKAVAPRGRRIQKVEEGTVTAVLSAGSDPSRAGRLRRLSIVKAADSTQATRLLIEAGRSPIEGDMCFLITPTVMPGLFVVNDENKVSANSGSHAISIPPTDVLTLMQTAKRKMVKADYFTPGRGIQAGKLLATIVDSPDRVYPVDEFGTFYDQFVLLPEKVTQALAIASRPEPDTPMLPDDDTPDDDEEAGGDSTEEIELSQLQGLSIAAVRDQLADIEIPDSALAELVTALRAGKHLLLSGPPGTGKSTIATAVCRAVMDEQFDTVTGTADWTTFDTIGGYLPTESHELEFAPGLVLRALSAGRWLIIDELNRADIDKAFGPLFSLLAGTGAEHPAASIALPFQSGGKPVVIDWAETRQSSTNDYTLTPAWRLIGTLNVSDKAPCSSCRSRSSGALPSSTSRSLHWLRTGDGSLGSARRSSLPMSASRSSPRR
jgi:energy-coupling factor transporter ATP-binding protein EcfA2